MNAPRTQADLEALIAGNVQENLHLDYKDSRALVEKNVRSELPKDVSAFANSDGGVLVYGIREEGNVPVALDGGVENSVRTREWIEQIISSNIAPRVDGIRIYQIPLSTTHSAYTIEIPKSYRGPHQERGSKRYYKRHNFESLSMEDYEIADLRSRARSVPPLVSFDVEIRGRILFLFVISNPGDLAAQDVRFKFSPPLTWREEPPVIMTNGIRSLPPRREYRVFYGSSPDLFTSDSTARTEFVLEVQYFHPQLAAEVTETFEVNLGDYLGTWAAPSPIEELTKAIQDQLGTIKKEVENLRKTVEVLAPLASPTGLQLSVRSLREIASTASLAPSLEKRNPEREGTAYFEEILEVDPGLARRISSYFWRRGTGGQLQDIEGVTPELLDKMRKLFSVPLSEEDEAAAVDNA